MQSDNTRPHPFVLLVGMVVLITLLFLIGLIVESRIEPYESQKRSEQEDSSFVVKEEYVTKDELIRMIQTDYRGTDEEFHYEVLRYKVINPLQKEEGE